MQSHDRIGRTVYLCIEILNSEFQSVTARSVIVQSHYGVIVDGQGSRYQSLHICASVNGIALMPDNLWMRNA
jgi:hypothetical protein